MLSMQPRSPSTTARAPLAWMWAHLFSAIAEEISPYLIENVPPKPQQLTREREPRFAVARVPARLAAAGLRLRRDDIVNRGFEELERRKSDRRPHQIDETGDEHADSHGEIPETGAPGGVES